MTNNLKYNASGYRDETAEKAIRAADKPPAWDFLAKLENSTIC